MLYAVNRWTLDWERLWATVRRWAVEPEHLRGALVLANLWDRDVPMPRHGSGAAGMDAVRRQLAVPAGERPDLSRIPGSYAARILRVRKLATARQRMHYLFRLCFPAPAYMRHRYGLPPGRWGWPYHLLLPLQRMARLVCGSMLRISRLPSGE